MPINCLCNKSSLAPDAVNVALPRTTPMPEIKKPEPPSSLELSNKLISHFLILNNKIVMELRTAKSAVLFNESDVIGFFAEEKGAQCILHAIKMYDLDLDGHLDLLEIDKKLFQWSATIKNKLYIPEFGYLEKDAADLMKYADEIFNQYLLIFKQGGGIQQKEGINIKEIHDLYIEKYWEFYAKGCNIKIAQPAISELSFFDPKKQ